MQVYLGVLGLSPILLLGIFRLGGLGRLRLLPLLLQVQKERRLRLVRLPDRVLVHGRHQLVLQKRDQQVFSGQAKRDVSFDISQDVCFSAACIGYFCLPNPLDWTAIPTWPDKRVLPFG